MQKAVGWILVACLCFPFLGLMPAQAPFVAAIVIPVALLGLVGQPGWGALTLRQLWEKVTGGARRRPGQETRGAPFADGDSISER